MANNHTFLQVILYLSRSFSDSSIVNSIACCYWGRLAFRSGTFKDLETDRVDHWNNNSSVYNNDQYIMSSYLFPQFKYVFSHIFTCKMVCNIIMISLVRRLPMLSLILEHLCLLSLWGKSSWFSCCSVHYITCITQRIGVFLIKVFILIANNQTVPRQKDPLHDPVMTGGYTTESAKQTYLFHWLNRDNGKLQHGCPALSRVPRGGNWTSTSCTHTRYRSFLVS